MAKKNKLLVEKRNVLNEMHAVGWTYQDARFLAVYLSKINARDPDGTRKVRLSISEFRKIMDIDERSGSANLPYLKGITKSLLQKVVTLSNHDIIHRDIHGNEISPYAQFQLFKECEVLSSPDGEYYIEFDAHDRALPLMFDFKSKYFTYPVENVLRLGSFNQIRMYEILAQHRYRGRLVISVEELRNRLGIGDKEYRDFKNFRVSVLEACQKSLEASTDISYTFAPYGKRGKGGKIFELEFIINPNTDFVRQEIISGWAELSDYSPVPNDIIEEVESVEQYDESLESLAEVTNFEFSNAELGFLQALIEKCGVPPEQQAAYLQLQLRKMNAGNERHKIKDRFKYLASIIAADADKPVRKSKSKQPNVATAEELERMNNLLLKQESKI